MDSAAYNQAILEADAKDRKRLINELDLDTATRPFNENSECIMHTLAQKGWLTPELPPELQGTEAIVLPQDNFLWSPLHHAAFFGWWSRLPAKYQASSYLTELTEKHGWTPLHLMAASTAPEVQLLLSRT